MLVLSNAIVGTPTCTPIRHCSGSSRAVPNGTQGPCWSLQKPPIFPASEIQPMSQHDSVQATKYLTQMTGRVAQSCLLGMSWHFGWYFPSRAVLCPSESGLTQKTALTHPGDRRLIFSETSDWSHVSRIWETISGPASHQPAGISSENIGG